MWGRLVLALALAGASPCSDSSGPAPGSDVVFTSRDFGFHQCPDHADRVATTLRRSDLVGVGTVLRVIRLVPSPFDTTEVASIRLERILWGASLPGRIDLVARNSSPHVPEGRRVLFWMSRECDSDSLRSCGWLATADRDDVGLGFSFALSDAPHPREGEPQLTLAAVENALTESGIAGSPETWEGARSILLVKLRLLRHTNEDHTFACDSARVWAGGSTRAPRFVRFPRIGHGCPTTVDVVSGSILLPIGGPAPSDTLESLACPNSLVVENGTVLGLGMTLDQARAALVETPRGLRFREGSLLRAVP